MQYIIWTGLLSAFGTRKTAYFLERCRELYSLYFKRGFKRIALESWPGSSLHIVLAFAEENAEEGGSTLELPPMFFTKEDSPAHYGAKL